MNIDTILESLSIDSDVKSNMQKSFNEAVELRAAEIAAEEINNKTEELSEEFEAKKAEIKRILDEKLAESEQKAEEYNEQVKAEYSKKEAELVESTNKKLDIIVESIDNYINTAINEFKDAVNAKLDTVIVNEKAELTESAFKTVMKTAGIDFVKLSESAEKQIVESSKEVEDRYQKAINENIKLKKELESALKLGIINEMKEGLSLVEARKFEKIADVVPFEKSQEYTNKLESIKESIKSSSETPAEATKEVQINESSKETVSKEPKKNDFESRLMRLI